MPPKGSSDSAKLEYLCDRMEEVHQIVTGGDEPGNGLIVRVDRLEQHKAGVMRIVWGALSTAGVALIGMVITAVFGSKPS